MLTRSRQDAKLGKKFSLRFCVCVSSLSVQYHIDQSRIALFQGQYTTNYGAMMAAATMSIVPMIILFLFVQRYIIEGITMSGLKL